MQQSEMHFEAIFFEFQKLVYNLALHYVQNVEDAEEITQDVFVKVYNKIDTFKSQSSIKTWIYRICINQSLDFIKSKQTKKRGLLQSLFSLSDNQANWYPVEMNHPGIELEQKEAVEKIFRAINQLPDNQKTAIILLKIEQKSQVETAEIMEISVKALESLFRRAKINLLEKLNEEKGI